MTRWVAALVLALGWGLLTVSAQAQTAAPPAPQVGLATAQPVKALTSEGKLVILQPDGTWKPAPEPKTGSPAIQNRPTGASTLVVGKQVPYGVWLDHQLWRFVIPKQNEAAEYQFAHFKGGAGAIIIAERNPIPAERWKEIVIANARREATDAQITKEERKSVNGLDVLALRTEGTGASGQFVYYGYYYTGPRGAIQVITYTWTNLFEQYQGELTAFLNGFMLLE